MMKKSDPTKEKEFQKVVGVFLNTPPKPHKAKGKKKRSPGVVKNATKSK
jgi:hypothetical protein